MSDGILRIETSEPWMRALSARLPNGTHKHPFIGDVPVPGYWRVRYPDPKAGWKPVAIVAELPLGEDSEPIGDEKFDAFVSGAKVPLPRVWPYCGRWPLSHEEYKQMMEPLLTPDESRIAPMEPEPARPQSEIAMYWSDGRAHIASALIKAQEAIPTIKKGHTAKIDGKATYTYDYADIADLLDGGVRKAVAEAGLAIVHQPIILPGKFKLVTTLLHGASGEWVSSEIGIGAQDARPQTIGSLISYYRRYAMLALLNIALEDDDDDAAAAEDDAERKVTPQGRKMPSKEQTANAVEFANIIAAEIDKCGGLGEMAEVLRRPADAKKHATVKELFPEAYKIIERAQLRKLDAHNSQAAAE